MLNLLLINHFYPVMSSTSSKVDYILQPFKLLVFFIKSAIIKLQFIKSATFPQF